jgi:hypothetical protein
MRVVVEGTCAVAILVFAFQLGGALGAPAPSAAPAEQINCERGIAPACNLLALDYLRGQSGVPKDTAKAVALLTELCDDKFAPSCTRLGEILESGGDVAKNPMNAATLYDKACAGNDADGCMGAGNLAYAGKNLSVASNYYERACDAGNGEGCVNRANSLWAGIGATKDQAKAVPFFGKGCQHGRAVGCYMFGIALETGTGVDKDLDQAAELYNAACDRRLPAACTRLGVLEELGSGVTKNLRDALSDYRAGCDGKDADGCLYAGNVYYKGTGLSAPDYVSANIYFGLACAEGSAQGCYLRGVMLRQGTGIQKDPAQAAAHLAKACQLGFKQACSSGH